MQFQMFQVGMIYKINKMLLVALIFGWCSVAAYAQQVPAHAQGLQEELISVDLEKGAKQVGVFSIRTGSVNHSLLAVLLPGSPSVVRPVVENGVMTQSKLSGNFLIRARRLLADEAIAVLTIDCQSESGDYCSSAYQASKDRQVHVQKLIQEVRKRHSSIKEVWLIGTSMGTISSSFMPTYDPAAYRGAIHTASITEPYARNSYRELANFDYKKSGIPQIFIHHKNDPCRLTTWSGAKQISEKYGLTLVTVIGGSDFRGEACDAFTEHGFRGKEREVMTAIGKIMKTGKAESLDIQ